MTKSKRELGRQKIRESEKEEEKGKWGKGKLTRRKRRKRLGKERVHERENTRRRKCLKWRREEGL